MKELVPATIDDAAAALGGARGVVFAGGGTDDELGGAPSGPVTLLRTHKLARILEYAPDDLILTAEAGVTLAEVQQVASAHRQMLALDPPLPERATVGGVVAANAYGPRRARYGSVRDLIVGVTLVRGDGAVARGGGKVVKNVAGFDLPKLVVGSLGTLGLVATATFRLHPLPEASATLRASNLGATDVLGLVNKLRAAQLEPSSVVAFADGGRFSLAVRFEGFAAGVAAQGARALDVLAPAERLADADATAAWARHDLVRGAGDLRARVAALPGQLPAVDEGLGPLLTTLASPSFIWYATLGLGFVGGDVTDAAASARAVKDARARLGEHGGTLTLAAAPTEVRAAVDAWTPPPPGALALMRRLKQRFDPEGRLASGRFVGGL